MCDLLRPWAENRYGTECKSTNKSNKHHITCKQATNLPEYTLQFNWHSISNHSKYQTQHHCISGILPAHQYLVDNQQKTPENIAE